MKILFKDLKLAYNTQDKFLNIIGLIYGYPKDDRDFFIKSIIPMGGYRPALKSAGLSISEINSSPFKGTGYVPNPKKLKLLLENPSYARILRNKINSRRICEDPFPEIPYKVLSYNKSFIKNGVVPTYDENGKINGVDKSGMYLSIDKDKLNRLKGLSSDELSELKKLISKFNN